MEDSKIALARRRLSKLKHWSRFVIIAGLITTLICFVYSGNNIGDLKTLPARLLTKLSAHPVLVLSAFCILPTFCVPISMFCVLCGGLFSFRIALTVCLVCIAANLVFSYFFYRKCVNRVLFALLLKGVNSEKVIVTNYMASIYWVFIVQIMPVLPYVAQNYLLATVNGINFWHYFGISLIIQFVWAYGFVCGGNAWLNGNLGVGAIAFLTVLIIVTSILVKFCPIKKAKNV